MLNTKGALRENRIKPRPCKRDYEKENKIYIDKKFGVGVSKIKSFAGIKKNYSRFEKLHIKQTTPESLYVDSDRILVATDVCVCYVYLGRRNNDSNCIFQLFSFLFLHHFLNRFSARKLTFFLETDTCICYYKRAKTYKGEKV